MGRVEVHDRRTLLDRFLRVEEVVLSHEHPDGSMSRPLARLNVDRGDGAAVVLHDPERRVVVLVRQFRFSTWEKGPGWLVELVAGTVPAAPAPLFLRSGSADITPAASGISKEGVISP